MTQIETESPPSFSPASALIRLVVAVGAPALFLFGGAGTWHWRAAWVYMAVLIGGMAAAVAVFRKQPDLARERASHWRDGTPFDRLLLLVVGVLGPSVVQIVCGLDRRFSWTPSLPIAARIAGACAFAAGAAVTAWAMSVNRFFSAVVRIQSERGHAVITAGPYAFVRHPGYASMIVATVGCPLLLGSLWALLPTFLVVAAFLVRTTNEDRVLLARLDGYAAYARQVRYRLCPGVW